jgi:hypothetical protein
MLSILKAKRVTIAILILAVSFETDSELICFVSKNRCLNSITPQETWHLEAPRVFLGRLQYFIHFVFIL